MKLNIQIGVPFSWYRQPAISCRKFTISYYKSFTVNKQKSVYKGYLSIYVPSITIICMISSHSHLGASVL